LGIFLGRAEATSKAHFFMYFAFTLLPECAYALTWWRNINTNLSVVLADRSYFGQGLRSPSTNRSWQCPGSQVHHPPPRYRNLDLHNVSHKWYCMPDAATWPRGWLAVPACFCPAISLYQRMYSQIYQSGNALANTRRESSRRLYELVLVPKVLFAGHGWKVEVLLGERV